MQHSQHLEFISSLLLHDFDVVVLIVISIPHILPPSAIAIAIAILISYREALDSLKPKKWGRIDAPPPFHLRLVVQPSKILSFILYASIV
jgi:hypothetical protein